jgi:outer membrane biosynthesis protein TonB
MLMTLACAPVSGQVPDQRENPDSSTPQAGDAGLPANVAILSDTSGVDVKPYVKKVLKLIYKNWVALIPTEAKRPELRQGETLIRFKILPDGSIGGMWLDGSTHDDAINRSCWGSITSVGKFPPLPAGLETRPLVLRIHYYVNLKPYS